MKNDYWEERYRSGGDSGEGSRGLMRTWKWRAIKEAFALYSPKYLIEKIPKIIDIGCGDLTFWATRERLKPERYIGIDISFYVINQNRERIRRPNYEFIRSPAQVMIKGLKAPIVMCIDLLFHIINEANFLEIIKNMCYYSEDLILINTWRKQPKKYNEEYQKYRDLETYEHIFKERSFNMVGFSVAPDLINCLYAFKRFRIG